MLLFQVLSLVPLTLAALSSPDAQAVYDDITGIDTAVRNLTATLNAYNGGIKESVPFTAATLSVHAINRKGFADATASAPFSSNDSAAIVQHVNDSVGVSIPESVKVLESKKPLFDEAQITSIVEAFAQLLKSDHETFSAATGTKLSADQLAGGLAAAEKIDVVLQEAALYFAA